MPSRFQPLLSRRRFHPLLVSAGLGAILWATALPTPAETTNGAGANTHGARPPDGPAVEGQPVEQRRAAGHGQSPAFPGQTRAVAVITKTPFEEKIVVDGLASLWALAFLPDGRILVTEKPGAMRIITPEGKVGEPLAGVPAVLYDGDAGLLDVILDPDFAKNRLLYFAYVEPREGDTNGTTVAKARLSKDDRKLENLTILLRAQPTKMPHAHYGCRLLFDNDGKLLVTLGERYASPARDAAQSLDSTMGKILRLYTDGTPAAGNPFEETAGDLRSIWSYGHRNPQGLALNPLTGELWETEHGPKGGDEVNVIRAGRNYGWPLIAYGTEYSGQSIQNGATQKEGMEQPVYYWDPAIAPSGMIFYTGNLMPEWKNNLFVCALVGEHVSRLVIEGHRVVGEERLLLDRHRRMRDIRQGPDGALWVVTDSPRGENQAQLIRIGPRKP